MVKVVITFVSILAFFLINIPVAFGAAAPTTNCQPIYGGGQTCVQTSELSLDLQVKHPTKNSYVDNLLASEPTYLPNQQVNYKITVKNTTNKPLEKIDFTVVFPQHVSYVTGEGKFDQKNRKLTFTVETLKANESKVYLISGKTAAADKLPAGQNIVCTFTQAMATFDKKTSQDNSQFCITKNTAVAGTTQKKQTTTKGGLTVFQPSGAKITPQTGPETLALIGLLPAGALGMWLRRKTA